MTRPKLICSVFLSILVGLAGGYLLARFPRAEPASHHESEAIWLRYDKWDEETHTLSKFHIVGPGERDRLDAVAAEFRARIVQLNRADHTPEERARLFDIEIRKATENFVLVLNGCPSASR